MKSGRRSARSAQLAQQTADKCGQTTPGGQEQVEDVRSSEHLAERLSELLGQASDLHSLCQAALDSVMRTSGRQSGLLLLSLPGEAFPSLQVQRNLPETWAVQVNDVHSPLRQFCARLLWQSEFRSLALPGQQGSTPAEKSGQGVSEHPEGLPADCAAILTTHVGDDRRIEADEERPEDNGGQTTSDHWDTPRSMIFLQGLPCTAEELQCLEGLLPSIARALSAGFALHAVRERANRLTNLQTELTRLGFSGDSTGVQALLIRGACRELNAQVGALILLDEADEEWIIRKSLSGEAAPPNLIALPSADKVTSEWFYQVYPRQGKGLVKECLRSGQPIRLNHAAADPRFDPASDAPSGLEASSMLCAPLIMDGKVQGVIQVLNKRRGEFNAYDQDLLSMIAALTANALMGTRLVQQLKVANADLEANRWELLGSRNTLRALFDHLPAAMYIIDRDYKILAINRSRTQRAGQPPQALVGQVCHVALFNRSQPCHECRVAETLEDGASTLRNERRPCKERPPEDGRDADSACDWEISTYPIRGETGFDKTEQVVQAIVFEQDVSDKRQLEGILAQSEKLAAIGQLAAGVAHEINNPLTAIIANAQILHRELPAHDDLQVSVDLIARAGARAAQVVRNLLDFARKEDYHLGLTDLNETVQRALELVQHELTSRGIRLEYVPDPNLPPILASQDHLQSVWLNLLLNAIDSLDKIPGEIKIATQQIGNEIYVSVADNGKGIPPERLTRIFEPFYTTKAPGRGTGLGLSVSHRIVKQHGGHIRVESRVGVGSEFIVVLPLN